MSIPGSAAPSVSPFWGLRLVLRVAAGTALFAIVLLSVQSGDSRLAGMMLTFPVLNGMSLMMTPRREKRAMAAAMLPVIALNGLLAHAFIIVIGVLGARATVHASPLLPWLVVAIAMAAWLAACLGLSRLADKTQWRLLALYGAASVILAVLWWPGCELQPAAALADPMTVLARNTWRIALFAATLGGLLALAELAGTRHGWLGRLGAFPILPLFSLAIIAGSDSGIADRMSDLRAPILIGLLLAMALAWLYAGWLERLQRLAVGPGALHAMLAVSGLVAGWLAVGGGMVVIVVAADAVSGCWS